MSAMLQKELVTSLRLLNLDYFRTSLHLRYLKQTLYSKVRLVVPQAFPARGCTLKGKTTVSSIIEAKLRHLRVPIVERIVAMPAFISHDIW